jgi:hypothetical protein
MSIGFQPASIPWSAFPVECFFYFYLLWVPHLVFFLVVGSFLASCSVLFPAGGCGQNGDGFGQGLLQNDANALGMAATNQEELAGEK